jgi:alanyl-tRNA synthetase
VQEVFDNHEGRVVHVVDAELEKNSRVRGHIDWRRRFDHMQQHTGQHLLSAALEREVGARTVSFHLGVSASTIDLDKELPVEQVLRVEEVANRVLWEDREVSVRSVTAQEAATLPLRKDPARSGDLRIIEITDYDLSACGGTHVCRTGAIGVIAVSGTERFKGGLRVQFVCGERARLAYRALKAAVDGSVRLLSVLPEELPGAIEKLQLAARAQQKSQEALAERLAIHEAAALAAGGEKAGPATLVVAIVSGWDAVGLKRLASAVVDRPATAAVLLSAESPVLAVASRSRDLPIDSGEVLGKLLNRFGGRGGGKGAMAQGGGLSGSSADIVAAARDALRTAVNG